MEPVAFTHQHAALPVFATLNIGTATQSPALQSVTHLHPRFISQFLILFIHNYSFLPFQPSTMALIAACSIFMWACPLTLSLLPRTKVGPMKRKIKTPEKWKIVTEYFWQIVSFWPFFVVTNEIFDVFKLPCYFCFLVWCS